MTFQHKTEVNHEYTAVIASSYNAYTGNNDIVDWMHVYCQLYFYRYLFIRSLALDI